MYLSFNLFIWPHYQTQISICSLLVNSNAPMLQHAIWYSLIRYTRLLRTMYEATIRRCCGSHIKVIIPPDYFYIILQKNQIINMPITVYNTDTCELISCYQRFYYLFEILCMVILPLSDNILLTTKSSLSSVTLSGTMPTVLQALRFNDQFLRTRRK